MIADSYEDWFASRADRSHLERHLVIVRTGKTACGMFSAGHAAPLKTIGIAKASENFSHSRCETCFKSQTSSEKAEEF